MRKYLFSLTAALCIAALLTLPVCAVREVSVGALLEDAEAADGIFVVSLSAEASPLESCGRSFGAGSAIPAVYLDGLRTEARTPEDTVAELSYYPVRDGEVGALRTVRFSLRGTRDDPPKAEDSSTETFQNLELRGTLSCSDPEDGPLTYTLVRSPKRGSVVLNEDGSFVYTPKKNKVGKDSFSYYAQDAAGNRSETAAVSVTIRKPEIKGSFADMAGDPQEYEALYLRSSGIFSGEELGGTLCFCPEKEVSAEEFLMMAMKLTELEADQTAGALFDGWFAPWQYAALRAGLSPAGEGSAAISRREAVRELAFLLDLPDAPSVSVFTGEDGAQSADSAMEAAGLPVFAGAELEPLTRRDAAALLCAAAKYCETNAVSFPWAKD